MADISITAANVLKSANQGTLTGTIAAGVTITQGEYIYQLANGTFGLADSNGISPANSVAGVALTGGSPGQPVVYTTSDSALVFGGTGTSGAVLYLSNNAGNVTATYADLASGTTVITLGIVNTDGTLKFSPIVGGVK